MKKSRVKISLDIGENWNDPSGFRDCVVLADKLGFDTAWLGDHFMPWIHVGGKSAFVWSLMSACFERTERIKIGPYVSTPIGARYHPAVIAQASATLDSLYPGRFQLAVGTGEAMNEFPFFRRWPSWQERIDRLSEGVQLIRKLWESESYFDFNGKYFPMKQVFLYTKPRTSIGIFFSALGPRSAAYAGKYGDNLITVSSSNSLERCRDVIFPIFDENIKIVKKDWTEAEKVVSLNFTLQNKEALLKSNLPLSSKSAYVVPAEAFGEPDPRKLEKMDVPEEEFVERTYFCSGWENLVELIENYRKIGTTQIVLYSGTDENMINDYASHILSRFAS